MSSDDSSKAGQIHVFGQNQHIKHDFQAKFMLLLTFSGDTMATFVCQCNFIPFSAVKWYNLGTCEISWL